ncbi:hypothetical protein PhCBS80983_g01520 [Powellomyces hirtus]|uniref:Nucleolar protein 16 n=1 Tax=Powellomyces hirtus TaxID=109895 RepID=A0A507E9P9_9FUNG|nr:ribosome biogenesis protein Nop16 [Powellomyces hirtus]TPX60799.1 hypothetical protein PhCBS80983_g01520 [Powellomyces hirtus]
MARPRARRTTRNPTLKVSRKQKNPYDVSFAQAHPLVRKNWDKRLTLKQNYERMGLVSALNGAAGGTEHGAAERAAEQEVLEKQKEEIEWRSIDAEPPTPIAPIEPEDEEGYDVDVQGPVQIDPRVKRIGHKVGLKRQVVDVARPTPSHSVVEAMEAESRDVVKLIRHASEQEGKIFGDLLRKHARDYDAMALDMKLNKYQLSAGQLKKRIERLLK